MPAIFDTKLVTEYLAILVIKGPYKKRKSPNAGLFRFFYYSIALCSICAIGSIFSGDSFSTFRS